MYEGPTILSRDNVMQLTAFITPITLRLPPCQLNSIAHLTNPTLQNCMFSCMKCAPPCAPQRKKTINLCTAPCTDPYIDGAQRFETP